MDRVTSCNHGDLMDGMVDTINKLYYLPESSKRVDFNVFATTTTNNKKPQGRSSRRGSLVNESNKER